MESMIQGIRVASRRARLQFGDLIHRNRLDALPPVLGAIACLAIGIGIPMAMAVDRRPPDLARDVAGQRLRRYFEALEPVAAAPAPTGAIHAARPAFSWPSHPAARSYRFRLYDEDASLVIGTDQVAEARFLMHPPGSLKADHRYRFEATPVGDDGRPLQQARAFSGIFRVLAPDPAKAEQEEYARLALPAGERALVQAGRYALLGSRHDVASELEAFLRNEPEAPEADLALRILRRLGRR